MFSVNYNAAFLELKQVGGKVHHNTMGESVPLSRTVNGEWFICEQKGYHSNSVRRYLRVEITPNLKIALNQFEQSNEEIKANGGRVFVTANGIYRKNKKTNQ